MDLDPLSGEAAGTTWDSSANGSSSSGSNNSTTVGLAVGLTLGLLALLAAAGTFAYFKWWRPRRAAVADASAAAEQQADAEPEADSGGDGGSGGSGGSGVLKAPMTALKRFKAYISHSETASQVGAAALVCGPAIADAAGRQWTTGCCPGRTSVAACMLVLLSGLPLTGLLAPPPPCAAGLRIFSRPFGCVARPAVARAPVAACNTAASSVTCRQHDPLAGCLPPALSPKPVLFFHKRHCLLKSCPFL